MPQYGDSPQRVDIQALMRVLPISGLEPQFLALIGGLPDVPEDMRWCENFDLLEPPAGQRVPYVKPVAVLVKLLRSQGDERALAEEQAVQLVARMRQDVVDERWVNLFDKYEPESPDCLPLPDFVAWLRREGSGDNPASFMDQADKKVLVAPEILAFLEQTSEVTSTTPMFTGPDDWSTVWSLENLPAMPPPSAMIEFVPAPPWDDCEGDWEEQDNPFLRWREAIRPVALQLEETLGEPVYYFKELGNELDDDDVHRFLVLHWCCTHKPESAFVRFLLKVSKAKDIEQLKAALIDPASYTQPFKMNSSFFGMEIQHCRFDYLPPSERKMVGIVFQTEQAREVAKSLLAAQIGARVHIVAPRELLTDAWLKHATRHCLASTVRYVHDGKLDEPISILAAVDVLCVIANEAAASSGHDLKLSNSAEDLLWLAIRLGVDARYYSVNRSQLMNPDNCLEKRGTAERVAAQNAQRAVFTMQLKTLRLGHEFGDSGLGSDEGHSLGYDLLDLPFPLVQRIAAWQRDFCNMMKSPGGGMSEEAWRLRHQQETLGLARALQAALGENIAVQLQQEQGWMSVAELIRAQGWEP